MEAYEQDPSAWEVDLPFGRIGTPRQGAEIRDLSALVEHLPGMVYRCEAQLPWRLLYVSPQVEEITGYPAEDFAGGRTWAELVHPDDVAAVDRKISSGLAADGRFSIEYRILHRSGETRWVLEQGYAVERDGARILEGFIQDQTERKRIECDLRTGQTQLATVFNQALVGILHRDMKGRLIAINDTFCRMIGRTPEELDGVPLTTLVHPDDIAHADTVFREHAATGTPYSVERRYRRPDGSLIWCEIQVAFVRGDAGEVESVISVFVDITRRKEVDEERTRVLEMLRMALEGADAGTFELDLDDFSIVLSPEAVRIYGLPATHDGRVTHEEWRELVHPDDRDRRPPSATGSDANPTPQSYEFRLRERNGQVRWLRALSHPLPISSEDGQTHIVGLIFDDTQRKLAEEAARAGEALNLSITEASADGITLLDAAGNVTFMNAHSLAAVGARASAVLGTPWADCWPERMRASLARAIEEALEGGIGRFTGCTDGAAGDEQWWDVAVTPVHGSAGQKAALLAISRDVTEHRRTVERVRWAASHDAMTGLPNRREFLEQLQDALGEAHEMGSCVGLLILDVDNFKEINDERGHDAGDALLRVFAERLRRAVRRSDTVARLGGDEFAVILRDLRSAGDIAAIVPPILRQLHAPFSHHGGALDCRASIGAAVFPDQGRSADELMKNADLALYQAKLSDRGGLTMFAPTMRSEMQHRLSMLNLARDAIREGLIVPFYQPKVSLRTGALVGFEALLRWHHPELGIQAPATIAEAFADAELASQVGATMQERVFADMRRWLDRRIDFERVAINTSAPEFRNDDFGERLLERLHRAGVPENRLEVEITEETAFFGRNSDHVARALKVLRAEGVRVALDDFGTGFSSLSHLKEFAVDVLKIDRSFIEDLGAAGRSENAAIVDAVLGMGKSLGIEIVAEGIEDEAQARVLRANGCDTGQGFLFGCPIPAADVPALVEAWQKQGRSRRLG